MEKQREKAAKRLERRRTAGSLIPEDEIPLTLEEEGTPENPTTNPPGQPGASAE